ncbi:hypothetical protein M5689_002617 [Euphorbia peplus]|nr:hypothetical protein M5689_002617 [Euphorbia peplus]
MKVKALVDKEKNNKVVFAECDEEFVDVLFSFMTFPMVTIVQLTEKPQKVAIGCMNNLYRSVQNLEIKYFRTLDCQKMLIHPRNGAETYFTRLQVKLDDHTYIYSGEKYQGRSSSSVKEGAFLKPLNRLVISDDLQVIPPTNSLLSDLGVEDTAARALEAREFHIGGYEVIDLLKRSLVSMETLTETLVKENVSHKENVYRGTSYSSFKRNFRFAEAENGRKIGVKLFVSKSKKMVCFAEVSEDFVDLVFSFLIIPLGYILKQMQGSSIERSINNLYKSIEDLDVEYFKSSNEKQMLLNPKIAPKFGYENQLIGVEEVNCDVFFNNTSIFSIRVNDPKIPSQKEDKSNGGFMAGPAKFTVTDNLDVIPISPVSGVSILNSLDVPLSDVQERSVFIGKKEALCLLVASFVSGSALTHAFLKN